MATSSTTFNNLNSDQTTSSPNATACPYHRALHFIQKNQLSAKSLFPKNTLWNKIQLGKKLISSIFLAVLLGLAFFSNSWIIFFQRVTFLSFWIIIVPFFLVIFLALISNTHPAITFIFKLTQYGLSQYHRAFFETFDSSKDYASYRSFIFWGTKKLVVRNEKLVAEILKNQKVFDRVSIQENEYLPFNNKSVLGAGCGESWLKYRKSFADYFSKNYIHDLPKIKEITEQAVQKWKQKGAINLLEELFKLVVEIRGEVFFQKSFGCLNEPFDKDNFAYIVSKVLEAPTFILGGNPENIVEQFHTEVIEAIRSANKSGSLGNICKTKFETGEFTSEEAIQNASLFILAQAPTMILFWTFLRAAQAKNGKKLAENPKEIIQHLKEELRIHPAVPTIFKRVAQQDFQVGELTIEKGTEVVISQLYIHQNSEQWANPSQFDPSKWEVNSNSAREILINKTDQKDQNGRPQNTSGCPFLNSKSGLRYLPFGHGKHQCQGRKYAAEEIFFIAQTVFEKVDLTLADPTDLLDLPVAQQTKTHTYNCPKSDVRLYVY